MAGDDGTGGSWDGDRTRPSSVVAVGDCRNGRCCEVVAMTDLGFE